MLSQDLKTYLVVAALLLIIGVYGVVQRRSFIGMLISAELILAGAGLNFMGSSWPVFEITRTEGKCR